MSNLSRRGENLVPANALILQGESVPDLDAVRAQIAADPLVVDAKARHEDAKAAADKLQKTVVRLGARAKECTEALSGADADLRDSLIAGDRPQIDARLLSTIYMTREYTAIVSAVDYVMTFERPAAEVAQLRAAADEFRAEGDVALGLANERAQRISDALASAVQGEGSIEIGFTGVAGWLKSRSQDLHAQGYKLRERADELEKYWVNLRVGLQSNRGGAITSANVR